MVADYFNSDVIAAFAKKRPEPFSGLLEIEDYALLNQITAFGRPADSASEEYVVNQIT
jgi:succinate dehydrogenase flavin-adding protein (antitoxin of CptAB toxin-antitoxin module)